MRIFSSELAHNYNSYTFGYTNYGELEEGDSLRDVYNAGFLPYSGAPDTKGIFYMARSARVPLQKWQMTSENRRIAKKFDGMFEKRRVPSAEFNADEAFYNFCLQYFAQRHGALAMPRERLELILNSGLITSIVSYSQNGHAVACAFEVEHEQMAHYWYSFYNLSLVEKSLGMWLMLDGVRNAQERRLAHYYLGTVYGEKALYKTNFEPLEWWDGEEWQSDINTLRERGRSDHERLVALVDGWKQNKKLF